MPQQAAGIRTEPPVSVPSPTSAVAVATATAEPLDEPPGTRPASSGFTGVPDHGFVPAAAEHSLVRLVLPTILAPDPDSHGLGAVDGGDPRSAYGRIRR